MSIELILSAVVVPMDLETHDSSVEYAFQSSGALCMTYDTCLVNNGLLFFLYGAPTESCQVPCLKRSLDNVDPSNAPLRHNSIACPGADSRFCSWHSEHSLCKRLAFWVLVVRQAGP